MRERFTPIDIGEYPVDPLTLFAAAALAMALVLRLTLGRVDPDGASGLRSLGDYVLLYGVILVLVTLVV